MFIICHYFHNDIMSKYDKDDVKIKERMRKAIEAEKSQDSFPST